tara:strand:- start:1850 stop:3643 length:1794 start_codon:yes stop_codon:yes gene_type:complete
MITQQYIEKLKALGFEHVDVLDFEYKQTDGNPPKPVCIVIKDLFTEKTIKEWLVNKKFKYPHPIQKTLFVCHWAVAEVSCLIELGIDKPRAVFDTFIEEKKMFNGILRGFGLVDVCERHGIKGVMSHEKKEIWRKYIADNYPNYTTEDEAGIMGYCEEDVVTTEKLFLSQLDKLTKKDNNFNRIISQACFHGKAMGYCAQVEANGIHIDHKLFKDFRANFEKIKKLEIEEINKLCNVFDGDTFNQKKFEEFLKKEQLYKRWPKTPTGKPKTDDRTFYRFQHIPKIFALKNSLFIINSQKLKGYQLGEDNRSRSRLNMFGQLTGRTNVSTATNPFGAPRMMRTMIHPDEDSVYGYFDFKAQEPNVMAALSQDKNMLAAVNSPDPYLYVAKFVKAVPEYATKKSHPVERERYKVSYLAIAYDQTPYGLSAKLGVSLAKATFIHSNILNAFKDYKFWIKGVKVNAGRRGFFETKYGWKYHLNDESKVNPKRLSNYPIQANGGEVLRMAMIDVMEGGFDKNLSMIIHDALLLHIPRKNLAASVRKIKSLMEKAAEKVIGRKITVDTKIIRKHFYQEDEHQKRWDMLYGKYLKAKECTNIGQ